MKLTKLTLIAMLLALLVCTFVACGSPAETDEGNETANDSQTESPPETDPTPTDPIETECQHIIVEEIEEPTCELRGYKREICSVCNEQLSVKPINMVDHVAVAPATCTEGSVCKFCNAVIEAATGHKIGEVTEIKEATATEAGYEKGACTLCGEAITNIIPAGIAITFDDQAEGALTADAFAALEGFEILIPDATNGTYTIVADGDNKYIKRSEVRETISFKDLTGVLKNKFAFSMDLRLVSAKPTNSGVISVKDSTEKAVEHRVVSSWEDGKLRFGKNTAIHLSPFESEWFNLRVVVDPATYDYEIWIDGEKVAYTVSDADATNGHMLWTLSDGQWSGEPIPDRFVSDGVIPTDSSIGVSYIHLFHYSTTAMDIDNMRLEIFPAE